MLLPLGELAVGVALIPASTARAAAIAALGLLVVFSIAITVNLLVGRTPDCHCFGQLHSAPIGPRLLVRNAILAALGVLIVVEGGGPSLGAWWSSLSRPAQVAVAEGVALGLLAIGAGTVLWKLFVRYGGSSPRRAPRRGRPDGRRGNVRRAAPVFELGGLYGETISLASLTRGDGPSCSCSRTLTAAPATRSSRRRGVAARPPGCFHLAVVSRGGMQANLNKFAAAGATDILVQQDNEVADAYGVAGTPCLMVVSPDGYLDGPPATGADEIRRRILKLLGTPSTHVEMGRGTPEVELTHVHGAPGIGEPAPGFELQDRDGLQCRSRGSSVGGSPWCSGTRSAASARNSSHSCSTGSGARQRQETIVISAGTAEEVKGSGSRRRCSSMSSSPPGRRSVQPEPRWRSRSTRPARSPRGWRSGPGRDGAPRDGIDVALGSSIHGSAA